jgi:predicted dehydrogenase
VRRKKILKTLVCGLGRIAWKLEKDPLRLKPCTHIGAMTHPDFQEGFQISGVWDTNPEAYQELIDSKILKNTPKLLPPESWKDHEFDLMVIATPTSSHIPLMKMGLDLGVKGIMVEKPASFNSEDLKEIIQISQAKNIPIWVNHERRYHPIYLWAKNQIQSSDSDWKTVRASVLLHKPNPKRTHTVEFGGPAIHDGTHALDLILWMFSPPESVITKVYPSEIPGVEERTISLCFHQKSLISCIELGGSREYFLFEIDIQSNRERIILSNDGHKYFVRKESGLYQGFYSLVEEPIPDQGSKQPFMNLYEEIYLNLISESKINSSSIQDSVSLIQWIEQILSKNQKHNVSL